MTKRMRKRMISFLLAFAMVCTSLVLPGNNSTSQAAKKASLRTKKLTVTVGKKKTIKIKNKVKKAKYTFKSKKKKIATVSKKGVVKGKKKGTTYITVTETKKKKKRTVGKVKVIVKKKKVVGPNTPIVTVTPTPDNGSSNNNPGQTTPPDNGGGNNNPEQTTPPEGEKPDPTKTPGGDKPGQEIDPDDATYGVTWEPLPIEENFESADDAIVLNSATQKTTYVEKGGVDDSGYAVIEADQYNGPTIFFDNRLGTEDKTFLCSAYIKANDKAGLYNKVDMWVGNAYGTSAYVEGMYSIPASRKLSDKWEQIIGVIKVSAGKFKEIRIKSNNATYCIDKLIAKELEAGDNTQMEPEPVKPAPENPLVETFSLTKDQITMDPASWEATKNADGTFNIPSGYRTLIIPLPDYVDCTKFTGITLKGSMDTKFRLTCYNEFKENLMPNDGWVYVEQGFEEKSTVSIAITGYAKYLVIGSCDTGDVTVDLDSITFNKKASTDGKTEANKEVGDNNPITTQRFTADPYAIEYNGTVYVYGTNDSEQLVADEDGEYPENNFSKIKSLNCYSSKDMVNWKDEGTIKVGGADGAAKWAGNSWAPAVAYKKINGKDKFFIYFANSANNIGVLEGDSPTGPWRDPIGKPLIDRDTPNCSTDDIGWLFDPAVLVDDDGQGYLYFGGIGDVEEREHPKCSRVVKLGDDMVSLKEDPVTIDAPGMFEDSGINKIGDKYYYSYCTNFSSGETTGKYGNGTIVYMVSDDPITGWKMGGAVLDNPGKFFPGISGNNHHCILERNGELYMFYHTMKVSSEMGLPSGYRSTSIDKVTNTNGVLTSGMTMKGVEADATFNPYDMVEAETFAWSVGTSTVAGPEQEGRYNRALSSISKGDYVGLANVAFGDNGAKSLVMSIASASANGKVKVYIDDMTDANLVGELDVTATGSATKYKDMSVNLTKPVTGTHKLFFVYDVADILVDTWSFSEDEVTVTPGPVTVEPVELTINQLFAVTENAGQYAGQRKVDLSTLLPEGFDINNYVLCNVDATFYKDESGTEAISAAALSVIEGTDNNNKGCVGKIALGDGTTQAYENGVVADRSFGRVQGTYSIPVENWRSDKPLKDLTFVMWNRTDIQSVKINSISFVPKADTATEYKVELNDHWDLKASEYNKVRELDITSNLAADFDVAEYDYCTIDAEFYSDSAGTTPVSEAALNALPYGEYNCAGKIGLGVKDANVWTSFPVSTTTHCFGRTQKAYDISLKPWTEAGQPGKILYCMYDNTLETIKSIKIKSITFKKN